MGISKNIIDRSDISTYPILLKYTSSIVSESFSDYGITVSRGSFVDNSYAQYLDKKTLTYKTIKQLYYNSYLTGSLIGSASAWNDTLQSTAASGSLDSYDRYFPADKCGEICVISMNRQVFGEEVSRKTFRLEGETYTLVDDGNGNLRDLRNGLLHVGNILYSQGVVVITHPDYQEILTQKDCNFSVSLTEIFPPNSPTPTPTTTKTPTATQTPSVTRTPTPTKSPGSSQSPTPTISKTPTPTKSIGASQSPTPTISKTPTPTRTPGTSQSPTPTATPSNIGIYVYQLGYSLTSGIDACSDYNTSPITVYSYNPPPLGNGTIIYTNGPTYPLSGNGLTGYYSNGVNNWFVPGNSGVFTSQATCTIANPRWYYLEDCITTANAWSAPYEQGTFSYYERVTGNSRTWVILTSQSVDPAGTQYSITSTGLTGCPLPYKAFSVRSSSVDLACSSFPFPPFNVYADPSASTLGNGTVLFRDQALTINVDNKYWTNGSKKWITTGGYGILSGETNC
jgi:hypothetical protein